MEKQINPEIEKNSYETSKVIFPVSEKLILNKDSSNKYRYFQNYRLLVTCSVV